MKNQLIKSLVALTSITTLIIAYIFIANITCKLFILFSLIYSILYLSRKDIALRLLGVVALAFIALSLLFTPISLFFVTFKTVSPIKCAIAGTISLASVGALWIYLLMRKNAIRNIDKYLPSIMTVMPLALLTCIYFSRGINGDVPYLGDECYHVMSVDIHRFIMAVLFKHNIVLDFFVMALLILFFILVLENRKQAKRLFIIFTCMILLSSCFVIFIYYNDYELISIKQNWVERVLRFPVCQAWISALLSFCSYDSFSTSGCAYLETAHFRILLPVLMFLLGLGVIPRTRDKSKIFCYLLGILVVFSIPSLTYYASVLYLDLAVVVLLTIALFDIRTILDSSPATLPKSFGWWLLVFSSFMKESVFPALIIIYGMRLLYQICKCVKKNMDFRPYILQEVAVAFVLFLPIIS